MLSKEQIDFIAELPSDQDFRFESAYGQTAVIVRADNGAILRISEDGERVYIGLDGRFHSFKPTLIRYNQETELFEVFHDS